MRSEEALKPLAGMASQSEDEDEDEDQGEYEDAADDEQDELGEVAEGEEKDGMVGEEEQEEEEEGEEGSEGVGMPVSAGGRVSVSALGGGAEEGHFSSEQMPFTPWI